MKPILASPLVVAVLFSVMALGACDQAARAPAVVQRTPLQTAPLAAVVHPIYGECLAVGNSLTVGFHLTPPNDAAFPAYLANDLHVQRNVHDCPQGHLQTFAQSGWCASQALQAVHDRAFHTTANLLIVQFGEDEWADASACLRNPDQYRDDLTALLAALISTSNVTLVCTDPWDAPDTANKLGFTPEQYGTATEAACRAAGARAVVFINLTRLFPTARYHGIDMINNDPFHPDAEAHAVIGQEMADALP